MQSCKLNCKIGESGMVRKQLQLIVFNLVVSIHESRANDRGSEHGVAAITCIHHPIACRSRCRMAVWGFPSIPQAQVSQDFPEEIH